MSAHVITRSLNSQIDTKLSANLHINHPLSNNIPKYTVEPLMAHSPGLARTTIMVSP